MATKAIGAAGGCGVPTIKPWNIDTVKAKMEQAKASGCFAVAMDVDAAGLPFLKNMTPPAGSKSVAELAEIVKLAERPFIVKGVMTVKGALKAKEAGAAAIVVSNHGGRVLDQCPATAEVLPEIAEARSLRRRRGRREVLHRQDRRRAGRYHADVRRTLSGRDHPGYGAHLKMICTLLRAKRVPEKRPLLPKRGRHGQRAARPLEPQRSRQTPENREIPAYGVKISFRIFRGLLICGAAAEKKQKILRFIAKVDEI